MRNQKFDLLTGIDSENIEILESYFQELKTGSHFVDSSWRVLFQTMEESKVISTKVMKEVDPEIINEVKKLKIERAISLFRMFGYLYAKISPLPFKEPKQENRLTLEKLGFSQDEERELFPTCGILPEEYAKLEEILNTLHKIYVDRVGIEYLPFVSDDIATWIQSRFEMLSGRIPFGKEQKLEIFKNLAQAEIFESFLHMKFIGHKRFSLEGGESLVPMLSFLLDRAQTLGVEEVVIGMSHRGRLNVVSHVFKKLFQDVLKEFHESLYADEEGGGDVKYHKGFSNVIETLSGKGVKVTMPSNPSHLESVDPVISGFVRAKQQKQKDIKREKVIPILIHGDAAISGQGVVYETLQLSRLSGYSVGGTIHMIINNHIGFTALPKDCRSTKFCTDVARAFGIPILHVNVEDPEACVWAAISALELRQMFNNDVFIELNCYRKYGHNESDEPAYTQPQLYDIIRNKKSVKEMYGSQLINDGILTADFAKKIEDEYLDSLRKDFEEVHKDKRQNKESKQKEKIESSKKTSIDELIRIGEKTLEVPVGFTLHQKLKKNLEEKKKALEAEKENFLCDWSFGETLAFGAVLSHGVSVRLSGQDSRRGTFSQRHAVLIDQKTEEEYYPLKKVLKEGVNYDVYDSLLSEFAVLGFEYGYSLGAQHTLVLWEAQFGDFVNEAQVVIDQYLVSGESKWGVESELTLLLPHGYEGQGPEHSSAHMERFLQLAAEDNIIIAAPTTPAQYYAVLVRQAFSSHPKKPLIIFTPKGLLRHPKCVSKLSELDGNFHEIIDDNIDKKGVKRILLSQGRIYYDIIAERKSDTTTASIRIEQLYPFKKELFKKVIAQYENVEEVIWVQEESKNRGAFRALKDSIQESLPPKIKLRYVGREESSSPATGMHERHEKEHKEIMQKLFSTEIL